MDYKLPKNWRLVKLGDECEFTQGIQVDVNKQKFEKFENSVQFLRIIDFTQNNEPPRYIENPGERYILNKNEIAMVRYGTVGYVCIDKIGAIANNLFKINPSNNVNPKYLINFFSSLLFLSKLETKGATMQALSFGLIKPIPLPLPPLQTQQAIVSKIEELFSELDKGIEDLKNAQQQLKTYRQSVLKWAFEGKLTNEKVKEGELPKGWEIVTIENIANKITDGEHFRPPTQLDGIAFLSAKDVRDNGVSFEEPLYISEETAKKALQRCNPEVGDILIVSRGATVGRMCIVNTTRPFCLLGSVILIKANNSINNLFLNYLLKSPIANQKMITISGATAQQAIYLRDIKKIAIPLPPIEEQQLIVQEIESRLSVADKMEESITQSLQQAEALRQSILKKAFSGELV